MDTSVAVTVANNDKQDNDITSRVGDINLENKSLSNHSESQPQVSTSVTKSDASKDGMLEGEEGELDYEEDETLDTSDNKQETPSKKTPTKGSDVEEGELEDGEVNSDGEEGEILSDKEDEKDAPKKKTDKEDGEINEDDLEDGEVRDQSEQYPSHQGRGIPRKLCRYFISGICTWGVSCRFLHPGVNDKGAYHMLPHPGQYPVPYVRPAQPAAFPVVPDTAKTTPTLEYDQPEDIIANASPAIKPVIPVIPEKETAWERGIRLAKENKKAAMRRKIEDKEFEQKRMLLSISVDVEEEEGNKENQIKRKDLRDRVKKDTDSTDRGRSGGSRWRDNGDRYSYKDKDKKRRNRSRRSISSSPERSKYDRRGRDSKDPPRQGSIDTSKDINKKRDKDKPSKPTTSDQAKKDEKESTTSVTSSKDIDNKDVKPTTKTKAPIDNETVEGDKSKGKGAYLGISNDRLANDEWHDPWQRTTSPKRRSPRRRSTSSYSSRSRSSSSSSASSRSSRSRSRTRSSTGSESRSSSRSLSRTPSRSRSRTPSGTSSRSRSRSVTPSSESDRSSTSSKLSKTSAKPIPVLDAAPSIQAPKPSSVRNRSISRSASESETPSESESGSERSRSKSPVPRQATSLPRSPGGRGPRSPADPAKDRDVKEKKPRVEHDNRGDRVDKYRQQPMMGWDRRDQQRWEDPFGRGSRGRNNKNRDSNQRRRRSRTPPVRRESDQRRHFEEAPSHSQRDTDQTRPISPRSRDYSRRDDSSRSSSSNGNNLSSKNTRNSEIPSNEPWAAQNRKRPQIPLSSGSVRYTGHKDIKLTLNKSVGKPQPSAQSSRSHSPPRQAEASSSSTGTKDDPKKRWVRPVEPEVPQRHSSPRDDVTSSQTSTKPIKRAADSVLTPRPVDAPSNKRPPVDAPSNKRPPVDAPPNKRPPVDAPPNKRHPDDSTKNRVETPRPLKRPADSAPSTKQTAPEEASIKPQAESTDPKQPGHPSNSSRREELLRELKAVEDAIARKRARIE